MRFFSSIILPVLIVICVGMFLLSFYVQNISVKKPEPTHSSQSIPPAPVALRQISKSDSSYIEVVGGGEASTFKLINGMRIDGSA